MQHKKRSRDHKNVCAVSGGTGGAAPSAEDTTQTPLKNQHRVPTMGTIDPYQRTRNRARRSAGRGSDDLPAAQTLPSPPRTSPAEVPPQPNPLCACCAGEARRIGWGLCKAAERVLA